MKKLLVSLMTAALLAGLTISASAASFTPSAESKAAPTVSAATITAADGTVYTADDLVVTSLADMSGADATIQALLEAAQKQITEAASMGALNSELTGDLVVRDLFDISVMADGAVVSIDGATISITLQTDLTSSDTFYILHYTADGAWELVDYDWDDAGNLVLKNLTSLSPFAVVVPASDSSTDSAADSDSDSSSSDVTSPQTGETFPTLYVTGAGIFAVAALVLFVKAGKREEN